MRNNRLPDFLILFAISALAAYWFLTPRAPAAPATPAPVPSSTPAHRGLAPFTLPELGGSEFHSSASAPAFITLTATGCAGCIRRVETDRPTIKAMQARGIPVYNVLVYADQPGGREFVDRHHPTADKILVDQSADVSVKTWGGSDSNCWFLLGKQGELLYRGPDNAAALQGIMVKN